MTKEQLSDDLRRFILTIPSIPHLEAILLLRSKPAQAWDLEVISQRLYLAKEQTLKLLKELCAAHMCVCVQNDSLHYVYKPEPEELDSLIEKLAKVYALNLIEITNLIHAQSSKDRRVQQLADAFIWKKDKQ